MYWAFAVATAAGLFMGCWFRIPALIASSVLVSIVVVGVGLGTGARDKDRLGELLPLPALTREATWPAYCSITSGLA